MTCVTLKEIVQEVPEELKNYQVVLTPEQIVDWTKFTNNLRTYTIVEITAPAPAPKDIKFVVADTADKFIAVTDTEEEAKTIGDSVEIGTTVETGDSVQ